EDVYDRPSSVFVADFVGKANRFRGRIQSADAAVYTVDIDGIGTRRVPGPPGIAGGGEVAVVVRPENLRVVPGPEVNGLTATVVAAAFLGAVRTVRLQAAGLGELTAAARGAGGGPAPGSTVSLTWDDDHAWLIPADADGDPRGPA